MHVTLFAFLCIWLLIRMLRRTSRAADRAARAAARMSDAMARLRDLEPPTLPDFTPGGSGEPMPAPRADAANDNATRLTIAARQPKRGA
jgi:hypothetical protein